jgi:hypothetical protein
MSVKTEPQDLSRRVFFQRVATYAVGGAIIQVLGLNLAAAQGAAAQGKVGQNTVSYQDKPKGTQRCDGCTLFQPPNACKVVEGEVSAQGWCSLFAQPSQAAKPAL